MRCYKSESSCKYGDRCHFRRTGQPRKKPEKSGGKRSVALLEENIQMGCVSQDNPEKESVLGRRWKLGTESHSEVLPDLDASRTNSGKEGSIAGNHSKMRISGTSSVGSKIRGKNAKWNLQARAVRPQSSHELGKGCLQTQKGVTRYVLLSCRSLGNAGTLLDKPRRAKNRNRLSSFYAFVKYEGLELWRVGYSNSGSG